MTAQSNSKKPAKVSGLGSRLPAGPSARLVLCVVVASVLALWVGTVWGDRAWKSVKKMWHSGMDHPAGGAAAPGGHAHHGGGPQPATATEYFSCGMHPWVILPKKGTCPICKMDLTPIDPSKFTGEVSINPLMVQNIGVRIEPVTTGPLIKTVRTVGSIDYDETRVRDVNIKVNGWIEKLHIDYLGAGVKEGEILFDLYSPELYSAQEEYLLAWRNRDKIGADFVPDAAAGAKSLLEAARTRLEYFDITEAQVQALEASGKPAKTMAIRSPHHGVVIAKHANEGMKVDPGMQVFRIADLSKVWAMVTMYEYQLPFVTQGQRAVMSLPYIPGQTFEGKVIYIYPYLDSKTRQVRVRLEFDNPGLLLKPGMYANVQLKGTLAGETTLAPRSAVIDTGTRQVAFVSLGEGKFEPRDVRLGPETEGGRVQILDGLKPGEMVVVSGQFLIDSEARMREALVKMVRGTLASDQEAVVAAVAPSHLQALPGEAAALMGQLLDGYFAVGDVLARDGIDGIESPARQVANSVDRLIQVKIPTAPHFWHRHEEAATVRGKALELIGPTSLVKARLVYADLSVALAKLTRATGVPAGYGRGVQELHCPMYREGQGGGIWLQPQGEVRNPFFGSTMLRCFDRRVGLPVTVVQPPAAPGSKKADPPKTKKPNADGEAKVDAPIQAAVNRIVADYLLIQEGLTVNKLTGAEAGLKRIEKAAGVVAGSNRAPLSKAGTAVTRAARIRATDLKKFRAGFKALSQAVHALVLVTPPDAGKSGGLYQAYCPMVKAGWLQSSDTVSNPYDPRMLRCGRIEAKIALRRDRKD
ncbi:MAG: efflux RND transporter periplasmic adaptor subunit [Phycisphaerae bacterium]|nr:efflux RND transporter periplasmic adaptor subunit [Phycisphaerae bacterium]